MTIAKLRSDLTISLAAGIFVGGALFDVWPEAAGRLGAAVSVWFLTGYLVWWLVKEILRKLKKPAMPALTAAALWFHSILEGVVTALAFGVSSTFGVFILAAMTLHILPEFFAAMTLIKSAGSSAKSSLATTLVGFGLLYASFGASYRLLPDFGAALPASLAVSGGAFLFVGSASFWKRKSLVNLAAFLVGAVIIFAASGW